VNGQIRSVLVAQSAQPGRRRNGESRTSSLADLIGYEDATIIRKANKPVVKRSTAVFSGESCRAVRFGVAVFVGGGSFGIPPDSVNPL
jgi:hypothetical protein